MHIFVGNLEFSATEQDIRQLFGRYGVVDTVRIMTDRETGRPQGFGFVEMSDDTAARAAIIGLFDTMSLPETSASPVALPPLNDALEEEDVFKLADPSEDADEDEEDSAFHNEDEGE
jgi:RNA recognition motif-containing protein